MAKRRSNKKTTKEDIHKQFKPNKTPKQVFKMGAFGGTYFRPIYSSVTGKNYTPGEAMRGLPKTWFQDLDIKKMITSEKYDKNINKYKVKAGSSYNDWIAKDWIDETTAPRGWIEWYCHFYNGKRTKDDERQIKRWINFASKESGRFRIRYQNLITKEKSNKIDFHPVLQQNLLEWGIDSRKMKP